MNTIDYILLSLSCLCMVFSVIGSFVPVIPDVTLAFLGLFLYKFVQESSISWLTIGICALVTGFAVAADFLIPAWGNKKFGGGKWGVLGCIIGLIIGSFFIPPFGTIIGCFIGAIIFEMAFNQKKIDEGIKAGLGSVIGYFSSLLFSLVICIIFCFIYFEDASTLILTLIL